MVSKQNKNSFVEVKICVGNCCFLKGSVELIQNLKEILKAKNLEDRVKITTVTCFNNCKEAISVLIDDKLFSNIEKEANIFFEKYIVERLEN